MPGKMLNDALAWRRVIRSVASIHYGSCSRLIANRDRLEAYRAPRVYGRA
jgi:hypothetical protein